MCEQLREVHIPWNRYRPGQASTLLKYTNTKTASLSLLLLSASQPKRRNIQRSLPSEQRRDDVSREYLSEPEHDAIDEGEEHVDGKSGDESYGTSPGGEGGVEYGEGHGWGCRAGWLGLGSVFGGLSGGGGGGFLVNGGLWGSLWRSDYDLVLR